MNPRYPRLPPAPRTAIIEMDETVRPSPTPGFSWVRMKRSDHMATMDTTDLRRIIGRELESRRLSPAPGDYAYTRNGREHQLYGVIGAANLHAALGFDFGGLEARRAWCDRVNAFQEEDGTFTCVSGPEHGAAMAILALNILGGRPARPVRHLAPLDAAALPAWLNRMDWDRSTHKAFCCAVRPVLASGFCDAHWMETLRENVESRIHPERPRQVWSGSDRDPPWRVISCLYHVLSGYDAAFIPYPMPALLWDRLSAIQYETTRNDHRRTACTDFDYAWMLTRLCHQMPEHFVDAHRRCHAVLDLMIGEWHDARDRMLSATTLELYCQCIGWAVYQRLLPGRFTGPALQDTLNAPWLYRLPGPEWVNRG